MPSFAGKIEIIGVNPFLEVPDDVVAALQKDSGRNAGPIPVRGTLEAHAFTQTVVKYAGRWRLYLNTPMRKATGLTLGDHARVALEFDASPPRYEPPAALLAALRKHPRASKAFASLAPSRQKEISRYLASMKTKESLERNVGKVIAQLEGRPQKAVFLRAAAVPERKKKRAATEWTPPGKKRVTSARPRASRSS